MARRAIICLLPLLVGTAGCGDSPAGPPADGPVDHVEAVVVGVVTDPQGKAIPQALVNVSAICFVEPDHGCPMDQDGGTTDALGRFLVRFELGLQTSHAVRLELEVVPPLGMGYFLGKATIEATGLYQPPPVADTTFVRIDLPPNSVDSRRPIRVVPGYYRTGYLRGDAERFYMTGPGGVAAVDPATGDCLWEQGGLGGARVGPLYELLGDRVVIAASGGLTVVRAVDGEPIWRRDGVPNRTLTTSAPDGFYALADDIVMAFDPVTGATRWTRQLIGTGNVVLAASAELVCSEILAYVECWEPATGERVWARPTEFGPWLAILGPVVILGSQTAWTAMDAGTGEVVWEASLESGPPPVLSEDGEHALACSGSACFAFRVADGGLTWRTTFDRPVGAPVVEGDLLYVRVGDEYGTTSLYVLDAAGGAIRERILPDPFDYGFCGDPAVSSDHIAIFGCGSLYTFEVSP
jgi:outer membrane protein assembly factor BamB